MQTTSFHDLSLSRLMLGTVQFGLAYGIANTLGKPDLSTVRAMLTAAHECGINCLDTAAIYGDSEAVIGQALEELGLKDEFAIVTKVPLMADDFASQAAEDDFVERAVTRSLENLRMDVLPICLFHSERNYGYIASLLKARERGLVRYIGSSISEPATVRLMLEDPHAQALQFPANVLDARYLKEGILQAAPHKALFVRSVYLQGLLLMPEESVPAELEAVLPIRRNLQAIAHEAGLAPEELYVRYILSLEGVASLVMGADTAEQVRHNASLVQAGPLDQETFDAVTRAVPELPEHIVNPRKWAQRMADTVPAKA